MSPPSHHLRSIQHRRKSSAASGGSRRSAQLKDNPSPPRPQTQPSAPTAAGATVALRGTSTTSEPPATCSNVSPQESVLPVTPACQADVANTTPAAAGK